MSLVKTAAGSEEYYIQYAIDGSERPGEWMGSAAILLSLRGKVDPDALRNLYKGLHSDGTRAVVSLSSIRNDRTHVPAYDFTVSAPKDVSLLSALFDDCKTKVDRCQRKAVRAVVEYIEKECAFSRRGAGGKHLEHCQLVIACFDHFTSRNNDPQTHSHLLILNIGWRSDGFGTIVSKFLYDNQIAINRVYLAALATGLQRDLGVTILAKEPKAFEPGDTFKIAGIPDNLRDLMSSRRAEILSARAKFGITDGHGSEAAALATRKAKTHQPLSVLKPHWKKAAEAIGVDLAELKAEVFQRPLERQNWAQVQPSHAETRKPEHRQEPQSNVRPFTPRAEPQHADVVPPSTASQTMQADSAEPISPKVAASIMESIARSAIAASLPDPMVERLIDHVLADFDRKHRPGRMSRFAERQVDATKSLAESLVIAEQMSRETRHVVKAQDIVIGVTGAMTSRDADAALIRTMAETGAIACVESDAGVDTSLFIGTLARNYKIHGLKVRAFAGSPSGAGELETATGIPTHTVGQLLYRLKTSILDAAKHHAVQILRAAMDLPTIQRWRFDSRSVVCITQAQSLRSAELQTILTEAAATGVKVILCGSPNQLIRREPHNAFSEIAKQVGKVTLSAPAIQTEDWMKDAVRQIAGGDMRGAFSQYALADRLHLAKDQRSAAIELVNHWRTLPGKERQGKTLIIADSARDTRVLNKLAQQGRRKEGGLGLLRQRVDGTWVYSGDRVRFCVSSKHYGFKTGDFGTIDRITLNGMRVRLDRTRWALLGRPAIHVNVPKNLYRGLTLGYAVPAIDAQGLTCDRALVLPKAGGNDVRGLLVQLSRARQDTRIFTSTRSVGEDIEAISSSFRLQLQTQHREKARAEFAAPRPEESGQDDLMARKAKEKEKERRTQAKRMTQTQRMKR